MDTTWPEQDAVDKWLEKHGIKVSNQIAHELKQSVTAYRITVQWERDSTKEQLSLCNNALDSLCNNALDSALVAQQLLDQTPADIICITKEELMEPNDASIREAVSMFSKGEISDSEVIMIYKVMITQLLKEREDK